MSNFPSGSNKTVAINHCSPPSKTAMPESMSHFTYEEIRQAIDAYNQSEVAHQLNHLDYILNNHAQNLSQWEIDLFNRIFENFAAKYNSPLAQETK